MLTPAIIDLSPEDELRLLEEHRMNETLRLMKESGVDEETADRYFAVIEVARNFQTHIAASIHVPYDAISFRLKFEWKSASIEPLRRYPYRINKRTISREGWAFEEIGIDGYDEDGSTAFTASVIFFLVPFGGDIRHQH